MEGSDRPGEAAIRARIQMKIGRMWTCSKEADLFQRAFTSTILSELAPLNI